MKQIKLFSHTNVEYLTNEVNSWISDNQYSDYIEKITFKVSTTIVVMIEYYDNKI